MSKVFHKPKILYEIYRTYFSETVFVLISITTTALFVAYPVLVWIKCAANPVLIKNSILSYFVVWREVIICRVFSTANMFFKYSKLILVAFVFSFNGIIQINHIELFVGKHLFLLIDFVVLLIHTCRHWVFVVHPILISLRF